MTHPLPARIASRIRWFSQLTAALDEAQQLLTQLTLHGDDPAEAARARTLVLALSCEVELLRREGFVEQRAIVPDALAPTWRRHA